MATMSVNYSNGGNKWNVTIYWQCEYGDTTAYMWWEVNQNDYGRSFQVVQKSNTGNRYNSGSDLTVGEQYLLYVYRNGAYSQQAGPFTVTAPPPPTYTISYNANGGSGAPGSQTKQHNTGISLSSTRPSRTGYDFLLWNTNPNGWGTNYSPGEWYTTNADLRLYAIWAEKTYDITYNKNTSDTVNGMPSSQTKKYNQDITLGGAPTRAGYTFLRWDTSSSGNGNQYAAGEVYRANAGLTLYAIWKAKTYTITFNVNGGSGGPGSQTKTHGTGIYLSSTKPSRTGYDFSKWTTQQNGGGTSYSPGEWYTREGSITLYAQWTPKVYTVTYYPNGASGSSWSTTIKYNDMFTAEANWYSRAGYDFIGWNESPDGNGTDWTAQINTPWRWTRTSNVNLYAQWSAKTYSVTYKPNGAPGSEWSTTIRYNEMFTAQANWYDYVGHTFTGWNESSDGTGIDWTNQISNPWKWTYTRDVVLFAQWLTHTYTIRFNANGGLGSMDDQVFTYDNPNTVRLNANAFTRDRYKFLGWSYSSTGSVDLADQAIINNLTAENGKIIDVYAVWEFNGYLITYNANGGTGAPPSQTKNIGVAITLSKVVPSWSAHRFLFWNTQSDGKGIKYWPGDEYATDDDLALYAIWDQPTYNIIYNVNGGAGGPSSQMKQYNIDIELSKITPVKTGYDFEIWVDLNTQVTYAPGTVYRQNANLSLTAKWKPITYTIQYDPNGGVGTMSAQTMIYDSPSPLFKNKFTKTDYKFLGWSLDKNAIEPTYLDQETPGNLASVNKTIILYAIWGKNNIIITYNASVNGGYCSVENTTIKVGGSIPDLPVATKEYYDFIGWFTSQSGGNKITSATTFTQPMTIYAQFVFSKTLRVNINGEWKSTIPFVNVNGVWKKGTAFIYNNSWKQGKG